MTDPCLPFPTRDPACETQCAESDTGAARCGPICPGHETPEWQRNRRRGTLSGPRPSAARLQECAPRASRPSPAPRPTYAGRCGPDLARPRADPSASPPTRANEPRRKTPSTPASASIHVPILRSTWLACRCPRTRTRCPRSRLSLCPDSARPRRRAWRAGRELRAHPRQSRYRRVAGKVGLQPCNRGLFGLRATFEAGPIRRHRHHSLAFRADFERHPKFVSHRVPPSTEGLSSLKRNGASHAHPFSIPHGRAEIGQAVLAMELSVERWHDQHGQRSVSPMPAAIWWTRDLCEETFARALPRRRLRARRLIARPSYRAKWLLDSRDAQQLAPAERRLGSTTHPSARLFHPGSF